MAKPFEKSYSIQFSGTRQKNSLIDLYQSEFMPGNSCVLASTYPNYQRVTLQQRISFALASFSQGSILRPLFLYIGR